MVDENDSKLSQVYKSLEAKQVEIERYLLINQEYYLWNFKYE